MTAARLVVGLLLVGCCLAVVPAVGAGEEPATSPTTQSIAATTQPVASTTAASDSALQTTESDEITVTTTLDRTPETVGEMSVRVAVSIPERVTQLTAELPDRARVTETDGLSRESGTNYTWDGETAKPTATYRVDPNRLSDREGPLSVDGQYLFADTEEWALVRIPQTGITGRYTGRSTLGLDRETEIEGPGVAGERMAFLGATDVRTRRAHGQTFRLVIPAAAELESEPGEILDSVSGAADRLRIGPKDDEVFMIAAPTDRVDWTVRGLQIGSADFWVRDREGVETASNVWIHEYVHTRQEYTAAPSAQWVTEGTASYYAALLPLEAGEIEFSAFQRELQTGAAASQHRAVLSDPDRWPDFANYRKGALVAGDLDRRIRVTTSREATFDQVLRELNTAAEPIDSRAVSRAVRNAAGRDVAGVADRYTTTTAGPPMWNSTAHAAAFGEPAARFSYRLADTDPVIVTGPTRTTALSGDELAVTAGETLRIRLTVENVGGVAGDYALRFGVNGTETIRQGRLGPGEQATHTVEQSFTEPGTYRLTAGVDSFTVRVTSADSEGGGTIDSDPPPVLGDDDIEGTVGNETIDNETTDNADDENTTAADGVSDDDTPGFGIGGAVIAALLVVLSTILFRRQSDR